MNTINPRITLAPLPASTPRQATATAIAPEPVQQEQFIPSGAPLAGQAAPSTSAAPNEAKAEIQPAPAPSAPVALADLSAESTPRTEHSSLDGFLARLAAATPIATIVATDVNWDKGAEVVSNAQKFVIPVPQFEGEALVYPDGAKDKDGKSIAGNPITDWQGQPIGDKGVVFYNPKDQAWQAVKSDGEGVVIMNQITEPQGKMLMDKIGSMTGGDPAKLTLDQFKEVLSFASSEIGWEKPDIYNSDRSFIQKKMNPMESASTGIAQYGLFRRDDRDVCRALLAEGPAEFEAPTSGGVMVKQPITEDGGVLVRQPDGKVFLYRKVDIEVMEETYTHKDGRALKVSELPRYEPA